MFAGRLVLVIKGAACLWRVLQKEGVALLVTYSFYLCALVLLAAGWR